jgi:hypothetical protein
MEEKQMNLVESGKQTEQKLLINTVIFKKINLNLFQNFYGINLDFHDKLSTKKNI